MEKDNTLKGASPEEGTWFKACRREDIPHNGGACVRYKDEQIAVFHFAARNAWFATQNLCPHRQQMSLSRGIIGDEAGEPKVACPFHKQTFSLESGACLSDQGLSALKTYPVRVEEGFILIDVTQ